MLCVRADQVFGLSSTQARPYFHLLNVGGCDSASGSWQVKELTLGQFKVTEWLAW